MIIQVHLALHTSRSSYHPGECQIEFKFGAAPGTVPVLVLLVTRNAREDKKRNWSANHLPVFFFFFVGPKESQLKV